MTYPMSQELYSLLWKLKVESLDVINNTDNYNNKTDNYDL